MVRKALTQATPENVQDLLDRIEKLEKALDAANQAKSKAEEEAHQVASAQSVALMQRDITEVATGREIEIARCTGYDVAGYRDDGREIRKPVFKKVKVPTYFYKIELPPSGGISVGINGQHFYHGETYEVDVDLLRTLKDIVHRSWAHEQKLKGSDENVYRKPTNVTLRGSQRAAR